VINCFSILLDTTYFAVLFFSDFVTCPCSFRTKRHNNLFVYDDDDDERNIGHTPLGYVISSQEKLLPSTENVFMQAALTSLTLRPQTSKFLFQHVQLCNLFLEQLRLLRFTVLTDHIACS